MNRRVTAKLLLGVSLIVTFLSGTAFAEEASPAEYTIPADLTSPGCSWALQPAFPQSV